MPADRPMNATIRKRIKAQKRRRIIFYIVILIVFMLIGYAIGEATGEKVHTATAEAVVLDEGTQDVLESRYCVQLSEQDIRDIAAMVYLEARGESFEGQQAVAEVILNRVVSPQFPNSVHAVLYQKRQFTPIKRINKVTPTEMQYKAVREALYGEPILPIDVVFFARKAENKNVWGKIGNHTFCYEYKW